MPSVDVLQFILKFDNDINIDLIKFNIMLVELFMFLLDLV